MPKQLLVETCQQKLQLLLNLLLLEQSLLARGMDKDAAKVQAQGDIIEVRFHQAPFENWIFWLDAAVRETRTRIVDLSVTRESPGVFSGRLALEMARRGK